MSKSKLPFKVEPRVTKVAYIIALFLCHYPFVAPPVALVGGFLFTLLLGHPFEKYSRWAINTLLRVSVVGLGFGMNLTVALKAGSEGIWLTIGSITIVLVLGYLVGKWMKIPTRMSYLTSSGTAICGGSAIAAVSPVVNASEKEMSVALGVVFFLNAIALVLFPVLGHLLGMSQYDFGMWSAIAIHDTSSVVGAASAYGSEALEVATTVKLARALWIIPLSFISLLFFRSKSKKVKIPWFIFMFVGAMVFNSYVPLEVNGYIYSLSKSLLTVTLFLIGSSLSVGAIKSVGLKPLALGIILWVTISVLSLFAILYL